MLCVRFEGRLRFRVVLWISVECYGHVEGKGHVEGYD